jgi:hypothetical protein
MNNNSSKNDELSFEVNIEEIRAKAIEEAKKKKHEWRQKGNYIYCKSCEFRHGFFIKPNKILVGIDKNGMPILKDKQFSK